MTYIGYYNNAALVFHVLEFPGGFDVNSDEASSLIYPVHVVHAALQLGIDGNHEVVELLHGEAEA